MIGFLLAAGREPVRVGRHYGWVAAVVLVAWAGLYSIAAPRIAAARVDDAYSQIERGRLEQAASSAKSAHSLNPLSIAPLQAWASAEEDAGNLARARELYAQAVDLQPLNWESWYQLGLFDREVLGHNAAARRELLRARPARSAQLPGAEGARTAVRLRRWEEAGYAALAAALGTLAGFLVLRPWRGSLRVPYSYIGDANYYHSVLKGVLEHGWFWHNPSLGAPGQQQLFDFPNVSGDLLDVFVWKFLGLFTSDSAVVLNLFFLLTFPAAGLSAYLVLRRLDLSRAASIACSVLFTVLPYHFTRGEFHLLLAAYYAVPLGAYLVLAVLGQRPLFGSRRMAFGTLAMCAVIAFASGGYYYSAFTIVLVAGGGRGARRGRAELAAAARRWCGRGDDPRALAGDAGAVVRLLGRARAERRRCATGPRSSRSSTGSSSRSSCCRSRGTGSVRWRGCGRGTTTSFR